MVLLVDVVMRWTDMMAHYSNSGIFPDSAADPFYESFSYSFQGAVDAWWWLAGLFLLQAIFAIALIVGFHTRIATVVSFIMLVSLQNRNVLLLNGGDVLLRVQLFWSIFLPMNRYFSVDLAQMRVAKAISKTVFNPSTIAIVVQLALLYWQTAALKTHGQWQTSYDALFVVLNAEQFSNSFGTWLSQFREAMKVLTWGAIRAEQLIPVFALLPMFRQYFSLVVIALILGLQGGIIITMSVGVFPFVGLVAALPLLPTAFWAWRKNKVEQRKIMPLTVYYDNTCGICVSFIRFLSAFAVSRSVTVKHTYDYKAMTKLSNSHNSWVGRVGRQHTYRANVFIEIMRRTYVWWPLARVLETKPIHWLMTKVYMFVSGHRHSVCKPIQSKKLRQKVYNFFSDGFTMAGQASVLVLIVTISIWVYSDIPKVEDVNVTGPYRTAVRYLRLDQTWNMFAPSPINGNAWFTTEATTRDGETIDVWRSFWGDDTTVSDEKVSHAYRTYVNPRWRRFLTRIQEDSYQGHRAGYLDFLCMSWNKENPDNQVSDIRLYLHYEVTNYKGDQETINKYDSASVSCPLN